MQNRVYPSLQVKNWLLGRFYAKLFLFVLAAAFALTSMSYAGKSDAKTQYTRIISLYSAHTENLVRLGAAELIVGISPSDNYPPHILNKKRFSYRDDTERFIAATPDLVLVRPMIERSYPQLITKLRQAGITVISLQPTSVDSIFDYWRDLGRLTGHEDDAEEMITLFNSRLAVIKESVEQIAETDRPRVYFESMHRKMKTFAPTSIAIFALEQAGGRNIAIDAKQVHSTNIAEYSKERILAHAEEIDVFLAQKGRMNPVEIETIRNETGFQAIKAVKQNRIALIDEHLVSRPTMRLIEGIEQLYTLLYPEKLGASMEKSNGN
jgi:iron complex transport system substrate-binding protein